MRLFSSALLLLVLTAIHVMYDHLQSSTTHTYVPPLTHTPGLGLSLIGTHSEPPFTLLDILHNNVEPNLRVSIDRLFKQHKSHLDTGVRLRIQMQKQTLHLIGLLPPNIVHEAWKNRSTHERSIGEIRVWDELLNQ